MSKNTQWKAGQSGNRKGRPKGSVNKSKLPIPERLLLQNDKKMTELLIAMATNDLEKLGRKEDIPAGTQYNAIVRAKEEIEKLKKYLETLDADDEVEEEEETPLFSTKAM